jgi:hypothetical protein
MLLGIGCLAWLAAGAAACSSSKGPADAGSTTDGGSNDKNASPDTPKDMGNTATDAPKDMKQTVDTFVSIDVPPDVPLCMGATGRQPAHALIADFNGQSNDAFGVLGTDSVVGATYEKPEASISADFSGMNYHITGTVADDKTYFGFYWTCANSPNGGCSLDVSQFKGIQFTIKGNAGPGGQLGFTLGTAQNDSKPENAGCGSCTATGDASVEDSCHGPRVLVPVTTGVMTKTYLWSDLTGGKPRDMIDPTQLTGILWYFLPPPADGGTAGDAGASYPIDITLDDVTFVTASDGGSSQ